ncbi:MAG: hypothetical protein ACXVLQ_18980 [Bacteriovorax sp.]
MNGRKYQIDLGVNSFPPVCLKVRNGYVYHIYMDAEDYGEALKIFGCKSEDGFHAMMRDYFLNSNNTFIEEDMLIFYYNNRKFSGYILEESPNKYSAIIVVS